MKLKTKPSAKINRRYLLIEGKKEDVEKAILDYLGILGWAESAPIFVKTKENSVILAVARNSVIKVKASLEISSSFIKVKKVSGTLKGLDK
jgi:RNase P/RNase MRP subunit POP5